MSQTAPTQYALSVSDSTIHSLLHCVLLIANAQIPNAMSNPLSCVPNFQQHFIHSHLKFFETCMPDLSYHLQLDAMHALGNPDPHSFVILHAIRPITHVRTDLIF